MEAASVFAQRHRFPRSSGHQTRFICTTPTGNHGSSFLRMKKSNPRLRLSAVTNVSAFTSDPAEAAITWQIVVGSIAGITPFVVAGIEFSKRIVKQRQCGECKGSGLVLMNDQEYIRCPGCGGWLPWLSWKRFFTG